MKLHDLYMRYGILSLVKMKNQKEIIELIEAKAKYYANLENSELIRGRKYTAEAFRQRSFALQELLEEVN